MLNLKKPDKFEGGIFKPAKGGGGWVVIAGACLIAAVVVANRDTGSSGAQTESVMGRLDEATTVAKTPSATAAQEATNIYNNYIAAARLCRGEGKTAMERTQGADVVAGYEALQRAEMVCAASSERIYEMQATDVIPSEHRKAINGLRGDCADAHSTLEKAYGKIARLLDQGGGPALIVEARDLLDQGRDAEALCHLQLAEAVKTVGGEVFDGGVAN